MTDASIQDAVCEEITAVHVFFESWFNGRVPNSDEVFHKGFTEHLGDRFLIIVPGGDVLGAENIAAAIRSGHGSNPDFRIQIRKVEVRLHTDLLIVATYEEWQRNARNSTPANNGRVATVVFERADHLRWCHLQETWLSRAVVDADPFEF